MLPGQARYYFSSLVKPLLPKHTPSFIIQFQRACQAQRFIACIRTEQAFSGLLQTMVSCVTMVTKWRPFRLAKD